ncbi:Three-Cys-motif partner protein [Desulfonema limicola]|uniref:Three-Cys-motif partner protein n=2 Tax=Desulfonema limicola TaxID=45656 RepID=A0A975GIU2_9BACT|nr:Three-Cys-motif partner protein [Desulfonema limicola]
MTIFKNNPKASFYNTIYVDAFAGTGYRNPDKSDKESLPLFNDNDAISIQKGSAQIALESVPHFNEYIFIEQSQEYAAELEKLRLNYRQIYDNIKIVQKDANSYLQSWCKSNDWSFNRAVVFLDPYGMSVDWKTIEIIAQTRAIDLWLLFPLGQAVNRLLTKNNPPKGAWADRLNRFFGTDDWKEAFYRKNKQISLFEKIDQSLVKEADFDSIGKYFINRLKTIFIKVAEHPLALRNSKNVPIFLLCFAASNPKGAPTAVKIAQHILGK